MKILSVLSSALILTASAQAELGSLFLERYQLKSWEFDIDHDSDGLTTRQEYFLGTNPLVANPPLQLGIRDENTAKILLWDSFPGAVYQPLSSESLSGFAPLGGTILGDGLPTELEMTPSGQTQFFRLGVVEPGDADGDGLSSVDEGLLGTNPNSDDTDGDNRKDGDEVFITLSDPLVPDLPGGTVRGIVFNDADDNGELTGDLPLEGVTVYLDGNFNGELDTGERTALTNTTGAYEFLDVALGLHHVRQNLPAPNVQTFPVDGVSPSFDLLPDEVVEYVHAAPGEGNFDEPYGENASENPANWGGIDTGPNAEPVSTDVILKPIGIRNTLPGLLTFFGSEFLNLPLDASVTVRFDEVIVDGAGPDFLIYAAQTGENSLEAAELFVGPAADDLTSLGMISQSLGTIPIDLEERGYTEPVQFVKLVSLNSAGDWKGFELVGMEAINIARPDPGAYAVTVTAMEVFEDLDFGRYFRDLPPTLVLSAGDGAPGTTGIRAGETALVRVTATDDLGAATVTASSNGSPLTLDADGLAVIPVAAAGKLYIEASASDSGGQTVSDTLEVYILNADGSFPFDPNLAGQGFFAPEAPRTRILTPDPGFVSSEDVPLVAEIIGEPAATAWTVEYAPVDLIDPYDLTAEDDDYIELATGSGNIYSEVIATLPLSTLDDGIYFVRLCAENSAVRIACYGQVIAKNVDEADLRPQVTIDSPASGSDVMVAVDLMGTITSARPVTEWFVEYARRDLVDLNNLNAPGDAWKRIAEGTGTVETSTVLASLDATTIKNNDYVVRVVANNDIGLGWTEPIILQVCGEAKFGRNRLEFTDVSIDLAGFPLQFARVYDSLQSEESGELGFGWSLALQDADISETVPDTGVGGFFGGTPFRDGARVYITAPTGERLGFTFKPEVGRGSAFGAVYKVVFEPDPGVYHRLEIPEGDQAFLSLKADGTVSLFFFDLPYNPSTYVLIDPQHRRYTYNEDSGFLRAEDLNGNSITVNPNGISHSSGSRIAFTRDAEERITEIEAPGDMSWQYTYDSSGDLVSSSDPEGRTITYTYSSSRPHYLESLVDPLGRTPFRYEYDPEDGRLVAIIDDQGNRREQTWDPAGFTGFVTSARGFTTQLEYDARGNVTKETDPLGNVTTFAYEDPANPDFETSVTDATGEVFTLSYDAMGNRTRLVQPINSFFDAGVIRANYDEMGNMIESFGTEGERSTYEYDSRGNLISQRSANGPHFDIVYDQDGRVSQVIEDESYAITYLHDSKGMPAGISDPLGFDVAIETNGAGFIDSLTDTNGSTAQFTYDSRSVPLTQEDVDGDMIVTVDNPDGGFTTTNRNGLATTLKLNATGRTDEITLPGGGKITPTYDAADNIATLTDELGNITTFTYDPEDRIESITDAIGSSSTREYNALGLISASVLPSGKRRTFEYNANRRLISEKWHAADGSVQREITFSYGGFGPLQSVVDSRGGDSAPHRPYRDVPPAWKYHLRLRRADRV